MPSRPPRGPLLESVGRRGGQVAAHRNDEEVPSLTDYKYHRVLLKLSGEALMGAADYGIVFNIEQPGVFERALRGEPVGTTVVEEES